jgi:ElaB/YqjD/DUF883 family membrane-anchored ribosome-binding protein
MLSLVVEIDMQNEKTSTSGSSTRGSTAGGSQSGAGDPQNFRDDLRAKANEAVDKVTDAAQRAGDQVKQQASSLAADAKEKTKGYFNQQVSTGADLASNMAESITCAADNLDPKAPQIASFVRSAAERLDRFSGEIREQSVDDLLRTASDFTRRQPAVVFGLASLMGFFLFRALKATPSDTAGGGRSDSRSMSRFSELKGPFESRPTSQASGLRQPMSRTHGP